MVHMDRPLATKRVALIKPLHYAVAIGSSSPSRRRRASRNHLEIVGGVPVASTAKAIGRRRRCRRVVGQHARRSDCRRCSRWHRARLPGPEESRVERAPTGAELREDRVLQPERVVDMAEVGDDVAVGRGVQRGVEDEEVVVRARRSAVVAGPPNSVSLPLPPISVSPPPLPISVSFWSPHQACPHHCHLTARRCLPRRRRAGDGSDAAVDIVTRSKIDVADDPAVVEDAVGEPGAEGSNMSH